MSDLSLQRTEAEARKALLDLSAYDVQLDLARDEATFASTTTITFTSRGGATFLDLKPDLLHRISLNGADLDVALLDRGRFPLDTSAGPNELVVEATMRFRNDGEGLHRATDPADGKPYVYGMSFMDAAPSVFACFDQPDLKAPYTFHVVAPEDWIVIGTGTETQTSPGHWELATTAPLSTYFVTLVAGPYHVVSDEHDGIPLRLLARASKAQTLDAQAPEILEITKASFDELHRLFGVRYPFGKYDQAFVPDFNAGAMENPGCITIRDLYLFDSRPTRGAQIFRAEIIAHEMAHQWFGNLVTPAWWDDLWLNEAFAEYMGVRVTAAVTDYDDAWADLSYARRQWGLVADQGPSTHPVAGTGATDAVAALQDFDGISYAKGSAVLRQLATTVGDEVFFNGVIDHFHRHRFGNATMHDLFESWRRAGAGDLSSFADEWLRTAGPDRIAWDGTSLSRTPPAQHPADRTHAFRVAVHDGEAWRTESVTLAASTPFTAAGPVVLDPYDDTWAALVPDTASVRAYPALMPFITDDGLRAGVWNNLKTGLHNALVDPADIVDVAVASLPVEDPELSPRRTLAWLTGTVLPLAPDGSAERIHAAAVAALAREEAGGERQLGALRYALATSSDEWELRGWLASPPDGIELDPALQWALLARLASLGKVERSELQSAYDAAPTADAKVELVRCLASLPDAEAKAAAWSIFTGETPASNYELEAAGEGMWQGGQEHLTDPYVDRYFAELPGTSAVRSGWSLADSAGAFFPVTSLTDETLASARSLAEDQSLDAPLRRRLSDIADRLARRLAIKAAYPH